MSKQSIIIAIVILVAVLFVTGYIIYENIAREIIEERKDEIAILLKEVKKITGLSFGKITEADFSWMVEKEGKIEELSISGKEIKAERVPGAEIYKINDFFGNPDDFNTFDGTVFGLTGFKKDNIVCLVVRRLCSDDFCDDQACITAEDFENDIYDITVRCGYLDLELEPISTGEIIEAKTIEISKRDEFEIRLKSNLSTGYQWTPKFDPESLEIVEINYESPETNKLGAEGVEVFKLKALKIGDSEMRFSYIKSWEDKPPIKKAKYLIKINEE